MSSPARGVDPGPSASTAPSGPASTSRPSTSTGTASGRSASSTTPGRSSAARAASTGAGSPDTTCNGASRKGSGGPGRITSAQPSAGAPPGSFARVASAETTSTVAISCVPVARSSIRSTVPGRSPSSRPACTSPPSRRNRAGAASPSIRVSSAVPSGIRRLRRARMGGLHRRRGRIHGLRPAQRAALLQHAAQRGGKGAVPVRRVRGVTEGVFERLFIVARGIEEDILAFEPAGIAAGFRPVRTLGNAQQRA